MNADGTGSRLVQRGAWGPVAWSPDGRLLLVVSPGLKMFVMSADGSGLRRVTTRCDSQHSAAWSPNGRKIVFTCVRTATSISDIYTVNVDGTDLRRLTSNPRSDEYPAWSPDSLWIAYVAYKSLDDNGLWVMRSDGTQRRRLTPSTYDSVPTWEPRS